MYDDLEQGRDLRRARQALDDGNLKKALRHAWNAGHRATSKNDVESLEAVVDLATAIRDRATGRLQRDAGVVSSFCSHSLAEARSPTGRRRQSPFDRLFRREPREETKTCPDCAEHVKAAARVCRFCGYRFDGEATGPDL